MESQYIAIKEINFNNIIGIRYKNWKDFCTKNNINYNDSGTYLKVQKKTLETYCKVKWIGREFIIKEVYDKPKPNISKQGRQGEFSTPIEKLLRYLPRDKYMSMSYIMSELFLITKDYTTYRFDRQKCVEEIMYELDKPIFDEGDYNDYCLKKIVDCFFIQSGFIAETIKNKLLNLQKNNIIELEIKTKIKKNNTYRYADKVEQQKIEIAEEEALIKINCNNKSEIMFQDKFEEFYEEVKTLLAKDNIILDMYYPAYKFHFVKEKKGRKLSEENIIALKCTLRNKYISKVFEKLSKCDKQIEYISNVSHGDLSKEEILSYLNSLCDFLLVGKEYTKFVKSTDDNDEVNGIPF